MSVWVIMPSKRPLYEVEKVLKLWRAMGYKVGLQRDTNEAEGFHEALIIKPYEGYAKAINQLVDIVLLKDPACDWIVVTGDDTEPDRTHTADEIAEECSRHFSPEVLPHWKAHMMEGSTFGVMQPVGDIGFGDKNGPYIERVAGSPWLGREFCKRINQGNGPMNGDYFHMGVDEELQAVAIKYGVFWQRPDLAQYHGHWGRPRPGERIGQADRMPEFLKRANSPEEWMKYKKILAERKEAGFPGSEPL